MNTYEHTKLGETLLELGRVPSDQPSYAEWIRAGAHLRFLVDNARSNEVVVYASFVSNGLSLCRLHHAAFDRFFVAVRPDYVIEIRPDLLTESDGPTLRHAIQALHGQRIILPRRSEHRPSVELLASRYERFL